MIVHAAITKLTSVITCLVIVSIPVGRDVSIHFTCRYWDWCNDFVLARREPCSSWSANNWLNSTFFVFGTLFFRVMAAHGVVQA